MSIATKTATVTAITRGFARMCGSAAISPFHRPTRLSFLEASKNYHQVYLRAPRLPVSEPGEWMDDSDPIRLTRCIRGEWQVSLVELAVIVGIARARRVRNVFEIGTFDGRTTLNLRLNLPEAAIQTIDLPAGKEGSPGGRVPGALIATEVANGHIRQHFGDSLEFDFSPWYGTQDLVFIDAGHGYRNALADSRTALRLTEGRNGVIIWHDYASKPGVTQAVEEIRAELGASGRMAWIKGTSLAVLAR